jgi:RNA polymerase sigma-B factor
MSDVAVRSAPHTDDGRFAGGSPAPGRPAVPHGEQGVDRRSASYLPLVPALVEFVGRARRHPRRSELRDHLVIGFTPLVLHIARRYQGRGEPVADLEQVGMLGLLGAIDRFDPPPQSHPLDAFLGYAIPTITGEIRRHFRDRTWAVRVPRRLKDQQLRVRQAVESLSTELCRAPRPTEIAARLGCPVEELIEILHAQQAYCAAPLDEPAPGSASTVAERLGLDDPALDRIEHREALRHAIDRLPERERTILVLRFFGDLTQTQIAAEVGLSQVHVSRLLQQSLSAIRQHLHPG